MIYWQFLMRCLCAFFIGLIPKSVTENVCRSEQIDAPPEALIFHCFSFGITFFLVTVQRYRAMELATNGHFS